MLTASAMQGFEGELEKALVLTLVHPADHEFGRQFRLAGDLAVDPGAGAASRSVFSIGGGWRCANCPPASCSAPFSALSASPASRSGSIFGIYDYGPYWPLVALTVARRSSASSPSARCRARCCRSCCVRSASIPAGASAPFVATLVDVTGLVIYFGVAALVLRGTLL